MTWTPLYPTTFLILALSMVLPHAGASVIAYDGFEDYTAGPGSDFFTNNGGTGWAANWQHGISTTALPADDKNMDYFAPVNKKIQGGDLSLFRPASGSPVYTRQWATPVNVSGGESVYVSFLWQTLTDYGTTYTGTSSDRFFQVSLGENGTGGSLPIGTNQGVITRLAGGNVSWQARDIGGGVVTGDPVLADHTYLVVMRLNSSGTSVWLDPTSETEGATTLFNPDSVSGTNWDAVDTIMIRTALGVANFNLDEIKIGTTFDDVVDFGLVPEPTTALLVFFGTAFIPYLRRASRRH